MYLISMMGTMRNGKLKELIFEIMGEININILRNNDYKFPIILTNDDIKLYLKQY